MVRSFGTEGLGSMGMEGPPGKPEAWTCRHCGHRVLNRHPVCPNCKKSR